MAERWVRPPVLAREPSSAWAAVWRFRLLSLLALALLVVALVLGVRALAGAGAQDPGLGAAPAVTATTGVRPAP